MLEIIKIGEHEFRPSGIIEGIWQYMSKSVIVDGETYTKSWRDQVEWSADDSFKNNRDEWYCWEIDDLAMIGIPMIKIWDYHNIYTYGMQGVYGDYTNGYCTNEWVNRLYAVVSAYYIGKKYGILEMYTDKTTDNPKYYTEGIKVGRFPLHIERYGFNNSLYITIDARAFIDNIDPKNDELIYQLNRYYLNSDEWARVSFDALPKKLFTVKNTVSYQRKLDMLMYIVRERISYIKHKQKEYWYETN